MPLERVGKYWKTGVNAFYSRYRDKMITLCISPGLTIEGEKIFLSALVVPLNSIEKVEESSALHAAVLTLWEGHTERYERHKDTVFPWEKPMYDKFLETRARVRRDLEGDLGEVIYWEIIKKYEKGETISFYKLNDPIPGAFHCFVGLKPFTEFPLYMFGYVGDDARAGILPQVFGYFLTQKGIPKEKLSETTDGPELSKFFDYYAQFVEYLKKVYLEDMNEATEHWLNMVKEISDIQEPPVKVLSA